MGTRRPQSLPRRKPGRKSLGARKQKSVKFPEDQHDIYEARAQELGISFADYIVVLCARAEGLPEPAYVWRERERRRAALELRNNPDQLQLEQAS
jgi:hypothetical protein